MADETSRDEAAVAGAEIRRVIDADGLAWLVRELKHEGYDRRGSSSLLFERRDVVRRVRNFPAHWRSLSDAELLAVGEGV